MEFKLDENTTGSILATFKHMVRLNYNAIEAIEMDEALSVTSIHHLHAAKFCTQQMNRMCNIIECLISSDSDITEHRLENFEIANLLKEINDKFRSSLSGYISVNTELSIKLKDCTSILIDKSRFEIMFLNLLYCCLKKRPVGKPVQLKISLSVTENKDFFVFHIRDNSQTLSPDIISGLQSTPSPSFENINDWSSATLISLSLRVAHKTVHRMGGSIVYTPLKSGNRFDISLPKFVEAKTYSLCAPVPYIPTHSYFNETFADIKLEYVLQKLINSLEGTDGFEL